MRFREKMAEIVRRKARSFLRIEPAQHNMINLQEASDYDTNMYKNQMWYRGEPSELAQFFKMLPDAQVTQRFWSAVPTQGMEIRKIHTGIPALIVDTLTSIIVRDMNGIDIKDPVMAEHWEKMDKENDFNSILKDAISGCLALGDGAFKLTYDTEVSQYPIIEFKPANEVEYLFKHGRIVGIVFKSMYTENTKTYLLEETYKKNKIEYKLYDGDREVPLTTVEELKDMPSDVTYEGNYMMAVPIMIFKSGKYKGRGKSVFDGKSDSFDAADEVISQWIDALRRGRAKEYIPSNMIPRNPNTGECMKPNAFDNSFIAVESSMGESSENKIDVEQPNIPHESYLSTYITALDLCLQGVISPSTLGIDTKKLDNAEAQREKEKTTLYTRNAIIEEITKAIPELVKVALYAYQTAHKEAIKDTDITVAFGEYANPSFESQVETVSKAKTNGIMSTEAAVEELYGDDKDTEWKEQEVKRIKEEQGIYTTHEPEVNQTLGEFSSTFA